jgi:predicted ATPase
VVVSANNLQVDDDAPFELSNQYDIVVKEKHNNQQTSFSYLSTGSMKLLYLLTTIVRASREGVQLLLVEELENSIHPSLLHSLLSVLKDFLGNTKLLFTSHSPNLVKYLSASQLYVGLPSDKGIADFRTIKPSKVKSVLQIAGAGDMALGEYLFKLMLEAESDTDIIDHFFVSHKEA